MYLKEAHPLRKIFLQSFVLGLIKNSYKSESEESLETQAPYEIALKPESEETPSEIIAQPEKIETVIKQPQVPQQMPQNSAEQIKKEKPLVLPQIPSPPKRPITPVAPMLSTIKLSPLPRVLQKKFAQPRTREMQLPQLPPLTASMQEKVYLKLGKLTPILLDPSVFSVECPGPEKNLIVNKGGQIQAAPITLTLKEVEDTINEISDKTRIPIAPGLFRATIQDLVITAIISSYAGTRFIIQKRNPFQRY